MPKLEDLDPKTEALVRHGVLHPHPERVSDELFLGDPFFDPRDVVQVKYEMLRRVKVDGVAATEAARTFGLSRPTFYETRELFEEGGLPALLPRKKGPRRAHKLSDEVMAFVRATLVTEPALDAKVLAERVWQRFSLRVHPRSLRRALERPGKR